MKSSEQAENSDKRASQGWLVEINIAKSLILKFVSEFFLVHSRDQCTASLYGILMVFEN